MKHSFPHPVLGYSQEVKGEFIPDIEKGIDDDNLKIKVIDFNIDNEYFEKLIFKNKIADIFIKVQCTSTLYCWTTRLDLEQGNPEIKINIKDIRHYVDIKFLIVSNEDFKEYYDKNTFDIDYKDSIAYPEKGDIIGITSTFKVHLIDEFKSDRSAPIFVYRPKEGIKHFEYEDNGDEIVIIYPKDQGEFARMSDTTFAIFRISVIYPSLIKCLTDIVNLPDDDRKVKSDDSIWFNRFENVVGVNKLNKENISELAWDFLNHFAKNKFLWKESIKELQNIYEN